MENIQTEVLYTWFADKPYFTTLIRMHDDFANDEGNLHIAVSKGVTVWFLCLSLHNASMDIDTEWKSYPLQHSALGLSAGSWINASTFRCYTFEGESVQIVFDAQGQFLLDQDSHATINSKLVQKYRQQWANEQEKVDVDDVLGASDAFPYVWGAGDSVSHIFTAIYFR